MNNYNIKSTSNFEEKASKGLRKLIKTEVIPSGVITLMFIDIADSTQIKEDLPEPSVTLRDKAYIKLIEPYNNSTRNCIAKNGGSIVKEIGDAFFVVFVDPSAAVLCAVEIQSNLQNNEVDTPLGKLAIRIGLHTQYTDAHKKDYISNSVDYAARVMTTAEKNEIVVSHATQSLTRGLKGVRFIWKKAFLKGIGQEDVYICSNTIQPQIQPIHFSFVEELALVVEGDNESGYRKKNIRCTFSPNYAELPSDLAQIRKKIKNREKKKKRAGEKYMWNGELYALRGFRRSRTPDKEDMVLYLDFSFSDWFTHCATGLSLDTELVRDAQTPKKITLREKYLREFDWYNPSMQPSPYFTNTFAIAMCLVTSDNQLVIVRRSKEVVSADTYSISVNETVIRADQEDDGEAPDLYKTVRRGCWEELGIKSYHYNEPTFLALCADTKNSCWGMQGFIQAKISFKEIMNFCKLNARDSWEALQFIPIDFEVDPICEFIKGHEQEWNTGAITCIYHCLVHKLKREQVDHAFASFGIGSELLPR